MIKLKKKYIKWNKSSKNIEGWNKLKIKKNKVNPG
jgi:hypothetical protein